ncbi:AraC family transcriptional regulator [Sphingobium sp. TB-6]|uniref:AraC family transcriptional regulator n=1 Tax=Sphingobium sp. TB-6 TaxID=2728850 RepID=UPI00146C576B|nr:AraC family transcriptional regulator [Sphingobium sp. TB-6]NML87455.1 AraC family transcriptional regulator [Sphingobium sp. TB-6]
MDPLSDLLTLLKPSATISSGFDAGGSWAVRFGDQAGQIKCYSILRGECWLAIDGLETPIRLCEGEAFVLPRGLPFRMASDLSVESVEAGSMFPPARAGGQVRLGSGGEFALVGARFAVAGGPSGLLRTLLPPILHLRTASEKAALNWSVERMMQELRENLPGARLMAQDLAHMMLLQALRAYLNQPASGDRGWLSALANKQLRMAIHAIHADPARRWTLKDLGAEAGMSRTVFAERFRAVMGETPMQYLTRWRMLLACDRLEHADDRLSTIAIDLGYESESSFSMAFKRVMGCSPSHYSRGVEESRDLNHA